MDLPEQIVRHPFDRREHRRRGRGDARVSARRPGRRRYLAPLVVDVDGRHLQACADHRPPTPANRLANASLTKAHGPVGGPVVGLAERPAGHERDAQDAQVILRDVAPVDGREYERRYCPTTERPSPAAVMLRG